jgi:serine/threonine protein kinase
MTDRVGQRLDNYSLTRLLGTGSFGEVYLADHVYRKTQVAVKVLSRLADDDLPGFLNEARTIRLRHPHIVQVLDFGVHNRIPFIVMEYIANGTLRQRYPKGSRLPPKIPSLWAQLQRQEETRRVLRRAKLVVLLLVSV